MSIIAPSRDKFLQGNNIFGAKNGDLGPANAFWKTEPVSAGTGTVEVVGTAVTGTGTDFQDHFVAGDYIALGTNKIIRQIATVTSDTALVLTEGATIPALSAWEKVEAIPLGNTGKISIMDGDKWAEIKFSQQGDSPANMVRVGYETSVEIEIAEAAAALLYGLNDSYVLKKTGATIDAMARTRKIGTRHSDIWRQLTIVKLVGEGNSANDLDIIHFPLAAPDFETKVDFDAASQKLIPIKFMIYPDYTKTINGEPILWFTEGFTGFDV